MKICFVGVGNMGGAILKGMVSSKKFPVAELGFYEVNDQCAKSMNESTSVSRFESLAEGINWADLVMLCVKPQVWPKVAKEIEASLNKAKIIVSIMAGVSIGKIIEGLNPNNSADKMHTYIRTMPNIALSIGQGAIAITSTDLSNDAIKSVEAIFNTVGTTVVVDESQMDAVTGLSGSGPAYVFEFIDSMIQGGIKAGLTRDVATNLTVATVQGAVEMVSSSDKSAAELISNVTSPGGTTIYGLHELHRGGFKSIIMDAILKASDRSSELGK